jgi:hypothetical protein
MRRISWLAECLPSSQEGLFCMELVNTRNETRIYFSYFTRSICLCDSHVCMSQCIKMFSTILKLKNWRTFQWDLILSFRHFIALHHCVIEHWMENVRTIMNNNSEEIYVLECCWITCLLYHLIICLFYDTVSTFIQWYAELLKVENYEEKLDSKQRWIWLVSCLNVSTFTFGFNAINF